jgi:SPP1 gp7 family putative phage head morphogenesis protein
LKRRRKRLPRVHYPKALEAEYAARIVERAKMVRWAIAPLVSALPSLFAEMAAATGQRMDASRSAVAVRQAQARLAQATKRNPPERVVRTAAKRVDDYAAAGLRRQVAAGTGVEPPRGMKVPGLNQIMDEFAARNVQLITNIDDRAMFEVSMIVQNGVGGAKRVEDIADEIQKALGVSEQRARLIARDQVGKLYGQVNAVRQQALGIKRFTWRTVGDEAVRTEHEALNGNEYRWADPPDDGKFGPVLPGEAIQCRCSAEPVLDFGEDEDPDEDAAAA